VNAAQADSSIEDDEDLLLVVALDGSVVAGIVDGIARVDVDPELDLARGVDRELRPGLDAEVVIDEWLDGRAQVGQATVIGPNGEHLGWVYLRVYDIVGPYLLRELAAGGALVMLGASLLTLGISAAVGRMLSQPIARRLARVEAASTALSRGEREVRVPVEGEDELARLSHAFNTMAERIDDQVSSLSRLAERNAALAAEASALAAADERNRLARDLHDGVKQQLFGLSLSVGAVESIVEHDPADARQRLRDLSAQARRIHEALDEIILQLRPASLADQGLASALRELGTAWSARTGLRFSLTIDPRASFDDVPFADEYALYRVAQEALSNVARHAGARTAHLSLDGTSEIIALSVSDDGHGFDAAVAPPATSTGLAGMRERLAERGGGLSIDTSPGEGTILRAEIPRSP
jgi:signal transduction histidine kinase